MRLFYDLRQMRLCGDTVLIRMCIVLVVRIIMQSRHRTPFPCMRSKVSAVVAPNRGIVQRTHGHTARL
jgi:hypothetical protein